MEANFPELASLDTWIGDLDGDGRNELLFAPHPLTAAQESTPLICYDSRGSERWRFDNRRRVRTSIEEFAPVFGLARFLVTPRGRGLSNVVLDQRSLNIDTFEQIYVLMGHALPEEAPACPVQ
jgi:hypothetical protein